MIVMCRAHVGGIRLKTGLDLDWTIIHKPDEEEYKSEKGERWFSEGSSESLHSQPTDNSRLTTSCRHSQRVCGLSLYPIHSLLVEPSMHNLWTLIFPEMVPLPRYLPVLSTVVMAQRLKDPPESHFSTLLTVFGRGGELIPINLIKDIWETRTICGD